MDRHQLQEHFAQAERHVERGMERVLRQRRIVDELARDGRDIAQALDLLHQFEELYTLQVADRERIRALLVAGDSEVGRPSHESPGPSSGVSRAH